MMDISRRAALAGGVVGNYVDQLHIFLPLVAIAPAMNHLVGAHVTALGTALVVVATLLGRPLGAMIFGRVADRVGRTTTTKVAIAGTAACTGLIAVLPTHHVLGGWTFVLLLTLRFLAGVFLAGEYSAAIPLAMEWSRPRHRGLFSGLIMAMAPWAQASIAFATLGMLTWLGGATYATWGWRVLFVIGAAASFGMLLFYRARVRDAAASRGARSFGPRLRALLWGAHRRPFWQMFGLMSGMWLMTNVTVINLTARIGTSAGLDAGGVSVAMGVASVAQAVIMSLTGHLSTLTGRRAFFVWWGFASCVAGPLVLWWALSVHGVALAATAAALLQVVTVAVYGPVGAYLSERLPASIRSTGYGTAYSLSIVIPALHPFYLPWLAKLLGATGAPVTLLVLGGLLVAGCGALGPALRPSELERTVDVVSAEVDRD